MSSEEPSALADAPYVADPDLKKYALLLSYEGTAYCGWQKQKGSGASGAPSIQETIEKTLMRITSENSISLVGSGRTDAGVHAVGQVAHFVLRRKAWDLGILQKGLNSLLPRDIRVISTQQVAVDFHAQRSAEKKQYSYYFQQGACALPSLSPYSWWIKKKLDLEAMNAGLHHLLGRRDFKPFQASGSNPGPTVREILEGEVTWEPIPHPHQTPVEDHPFGYVRVRVVGTGFLKQMVRGISGTLLEVGEGRRDSDCFRQILESADRRQVGPTAPARALWLEQVWYPGMRWNRVDR